MSEAPSPLPVHVLTGFLGSGKTTILNRVLKAPNLSNTAVVINEFGDVALDHLLVERSDDTLVKLAGGCVCCTVRGDLATTLLQLIHQRDTGAVTPFERIVIETSGLADPTPIVNLFSTDALLGERVRCAGVTATLDALNGATTLERYIESRQQILLADGIVLTKRDLHPGASPALMRALNPAAPTLDACAVSDASLCAWLTGERARQAAPAAADHVHTHGVMSFTLERQRPVAPAAISLFVQALATHVGAQLLRVKGLVRLTGIDGQPAVLQGAQHVFQPLELLPSWPAYAPRRTQLTCIVQGDCADLIEALFDAVIADVDWLEASSRA
ncbi:MAG: GTP-binding protein [Pseudomonadota bacterium]